MAGNNPNINPINIEKKTEIIMIGMEMAVGISVNSEITLDKPIPAKTPINPPIKVRTAASVKN